MVHSVVTLSTQVDTVLEETASFVPSNKKGNSRAMVQYHTYFHNIDFLLGYSWALPWVIFPLTQGTPSIPSSATFADKHP